MQSSNIFWTYWWLLSKFKNDFHVDIPGLPLIMVQMLKNKKKLTKYERHNFNKIQNEQLQAGKLAYYCEDYFNYLLHAGIMVVIFLSLIFVLIFLGLLFTSNDGWAKIAECITG